jgi:hypothetical protein
MSLHDLADLGQNSISITYRHCVSKVKTYKTTHYIYSTQDWLGELKDNLEDADWSRFVCHWKSLTEDQRVALFKEATENVSTEFDDDDNDYEPDTDCESEGSAEECYGDADCEADYIQDRTQDDVITWANKFVPTLRTEAEKDAEDLEEIDDKLKDKASALERELKSEMERAKKACADLQARYDAEVKALSAQKHAIRMREMERNLRQAFGETDKSAFPSSV